MPLAAGDQDWLVRQVDRPVWLLGEVACHAEGHLDLRMDREMAVIHAANRSGGEFAAEHVEDGLVAICGREDDIRLVDLVVVQAHADGGAVFHQDLLDRGLVADLALRSR